MTAPAIISLISNALTLVEHLLPQLKELVSSGRITPEQQAKVRARYESLRAAAEGQFSGPEWAQGVTPAPAEMKGTKETEGTKGGE